MTKVTKDNKGWRECSQKFIPLSSIFSIPIFSSTEFSILRISCGSHNFKVTSIKIYPRGFLCVCYSSIARLKVTFCQCGLLVPVYLDVKVNAKIAYSGGCGLYEDIVERQEYRVRKKLLLSFLLSYF